MSDAGYFHFIAITSDGRENTNMFAYMTTTHIVIFSCLNWVYLCEREREIETERERETESERETERERDRE